MGGRRSIMSLASLMVVAMMMINTIEAQDNSCASNLTPCAEFLNSTKPPSSCCDPLRKTVETQLTCLCNLFYTPGLLQNIHVNVTEALALAGNCGIPGGLNSCKQSRSSPAPAAGGSPPVKGSDKGAADRVSFTGFSFVILLASMLFN